MTKEHKHSTYRQSTYLINDYVKYAYISYIPISAQARLTQERENNAMCSLSSINCRTWQENKYRKTPFSLHPHLCKHFIFTENVSCLHSLKPPTLLSLFKRNKNKLAVTVYKNFRFPPLAKAKPVQHAKEQPSWFQTAAGPSLKK